MHPMRLLSLLADALAIAVICALLGLYAVVVWLGYNGLACFQHADGWIFWVERWLEGPVLVLVFCLVTWRVFRRAQ